MKTSEKILILIAILALGTVIGYKIYLDKTMDYNYIQEQNDNAQTEQVARGITYEKALNVIFEYLYKDNIYAYETSTFMSTDEFYGYYVKTDSEESKLRLEYIGYTTDDKYYIFDLYEYIEENTKYIKNRYAVNKINQKIIQEKESEKTEDINPDFPTNIINKKIENFLEAPLQAGSGTLGLSLGTFYVFYKDGTFIRVTSLMDGETRDRKFSGTYEIKNENTLVLNYTQKETIIGGKKTENAIYGQKIEGGTIEKQEYIQTEEVKYNIYDNKDDYGYRCISIDETNWYTSKSYGEASKWLNEYENWKQNY